MPGVKLREIERVLKGDSRKVDRLKKIAPDFESCLVGERESDEMFVR